MAFFNQSVARFQLPCQNGEQTSASHAYPLLRVELMACNPTSCLQLPFASKRPRLAASQKWVCMGGRCLLPTRTCEWEPSYTLMKKDFGNRCIQLRYTWVQAQRFHMLFSQPFPATNMRTLAAPSTVKQDAGGLCPVLSSHREACLEASCQLAAFLWQGEGSSILRQEVPILPLNCTWRYPPGLHC